SSDKVREAEQRRLAHAGATADVQAPPPPVQFLGNLRVTTNIAADVLVDGQVIGQTQPNALFEREIAVGEREVAVRAAGYTAAAQRLRLRTSQWADAAFRLTPIETVSAGKLTKPTLIAPRFDFEPPMIALPGGQLQMGSPEDESERGSDEGPRHPVRLAPFAIGQTEVTFAQYDAFCSATRRQPPGDNGWGRGQRPVINVSWEDAVAYAAWLSKEAGKHYRLPTEAEWEYAARAGTTPPFWTGRCITTDQANYNGNSDYSGCGANTGVYRGQTVPVGSLPANPWGLYEVHGNVWEWVQDRYHDSYQRAPADGSAWEAGDRSARVLRGGSWFYSPRFLRSASRDRGDAGYRHYDLGFRLASDTPETPDSRVGPRDATVRAGGDSVKSPDQSSTGWPDRPPGVSAGDITEPTLLMPRFDFEPTMIALPGGQFQMGSPEDEPERSSDESPRHLVRLAPFAIGQTEVTFAQYDAFCAATGRQPPD
ncbi:formylglycine-generating enzyme family protein, partial [Lamprocystis purpurea]|uniref:formylglycine-generating enzyme family protein n=1 Tax=Lamprocystis purpurea TaxID=61598 RepID=UPI000376D63F